MDSLQRHGRTDGQGHDHPKALAKLMAKTVTKTAMAAEMAEPWSWPWAKNSNNNTRNQDLRQIQILGVFTIFLQNLTMLDKYQNIKQA